MDSNAPDDLWSDIFDRMRKIPDTSVEQPTKTAPQLATPVSPPLQHQAEPTDGPGFFGTLGDMAQGIGTGAYNAVAETVNLGSDAVNLFRDEGEKVGNIMDPASFKPETGFGKAAQSISQFAVGFIGAGKFLKAAKLLQGAGKAVTIGRGMTQGAIADFTVFDANEERLSNLIESNPTFSNPITEYLAADKDDGAIEGRFKNTIEGMALGVVGEALFTMVRGIKASRTAKTVVEAEDATVKAADELEAIAAKSGQTTDELVESVEATISGDTRALADAVEGAGGKVELNVHGVDGAEARAAIEGLAESGSFPAFRTASPEEFIALRDKSSRSEFLTHYTADELREMKLFMLDDGVGFALKPDGDIVHVLNVSGRKGAGTDAIIEAIAQGGTKLDCIGDHLEKYYKAFGFVEDKVSRTAWNDAYAPTGWNYEKNGRPDIAYFNYPEGLSRNRGDVRGRFDDARRGKTGGGNDAGNGGIRGDKHPPDSGGKGQGVRLGESTLPERPTGVSGDNVTAIDTIQQEAAHTTNASASSATPAMKASMTRSRLKPEEFGKTLEDSIAAATNGKDMSELMEGRFLIGNGKRLEFNTVEEAALHAEYASAVWEKTLIGKGQETFQNVLDGSQEFLRFLGVEDLLDSAAKDRAWMKNMTSRVLAYKEVAQSAGEEILDVRRLIKLHGETPELLERLGSASRIYQDLSLSAKDMITGSARTTSAGRITPRYMDGDVLADVLAAADGNLEKVAKVINMSRSNRAWSTIQEIVINGLLSGPKTHLVNIAGNALKTVIMPTEKILGGAFLGDTKMMREGIETYFGLWKFTSEAWSASRMAMKMGDNILDKGHKVMDSQHRPVLSTYTKIKDDILARRAASGGNINTDLSALEELQARAMSFIGLPSRALMGMDEWFKQINYRANVYAKLTADATSKPGWTTDQIAEHVTRGMETAFEKGGRGVDKDALRYAQESTWTQNLRDDAYFKGGIGQGVSNIANQIPPLRLVVPFIRTPTNLIRDFVAHTPLLAPVTKKFRDAMAAGGERQAHALGQLATGSLLWTSAICLAANGKMTGGYPKDPATRQAWIDSGIEPYSFRIGDTYVSFARFDPFSTFFGIAADYAEYSGNWNDSVKGNWASGAVMALSNNLLSKSYLTGITDLIDALGDQSVDSKAMQKYMQRLTTMLVPYSSGLRFTRQLIDDPMREVRGGFDSILNSIPGTSHLLPERRSWITGKAISHNLFWGEHKNDVVANELARLGDNLSIGAPGKKLKGVELDGNQYSRLCELQGTIKIGGVTQHERLERLMKSSAYDMGRKRFQDMPGDEGNPRTKMVEQIVRSYREAAQKSILREDSALRAAADTRLKASIAARRGERDKFVQLLTMPK